MASTTTCMNVMLPISTGFRSVCSPAATGRGSSRLRLVPVRCSKERNNTPAADATPSVQESTKQELSQSEMSGDRSLGSLFAFDGAAPETINGRMAMVGFVWALAAERLTGLSVMEQLFNPATSGLLWFASVVQLFTMASIIPFVNGESSDARRWGPFNVKAERWNGRLAMIGFAALLVGEMVRQGPLIMHQI